MSKLKKGTLIAVIIGFFVATGLVIYSYYMPHRNIKHEKAIEISAAKLTSTYSLDEQSANQRFLDKAIQVTGVISGLETNGQGKTVVILEGENPMCTVRCTFVNDPQVKSGDSLIVKGRCTGFLSDVILVDCLLPNK